MALQELPLTNEVAAILAKCAGEVENTRAFVLAICDALLHD